MKPFLRLSTPHPVRGDKSHPTLHHLTPASTAPTRRRLRAVPPADAGFGFSLCEVEGVPRRLEIVMTVYEYLPEEIEVIVL